jgi:NAD(P)-dependent dehydrogenase (short-subunit alcohol dehydrogenase family)
MTVPASGGRPPVPDDRIVLVTGGGRGIGAATCHLAARDGYQVVFGYRADAAAAASVVADIQAAGGVAHAVCGDVADESHVRALFDAVDQRGRLVGLVNNAGVLGGPQMRLVDMSARRMRDVFAVNVVGAMLCAREAVRRMSVDRGGNGGAVINVSSAASRLGSAGEYVDYAATKGALDTFTLGLSREVAAEGIRVNAVRPGLIRTDIHAEGGMPDRVDRLAPGVPMGRGGEPEEVARAIMWLLSDAASYVTGALLDVTGGR